MKSQPLLYRVFDRLTRPPVLTIFAVLQACTMVIIVAGHFSTLVDSGQVSGDPGTGDFAAFFTGAVLVQEGRGAELYDFDAQKAVQEGITGGTLSTWQPYLNPPALAIALAPTTGLGYRASFFVFTTVLAILLVVSLTIFLSATPCLASSKLSATTALLVTVGFLPVALTTFGGQNTALTLALLAGVYAAVRRNHPILAGTLLGLLTFKPQYAIILGLVFLIQRQIVVVSVAALVGILHYVIGAAVCGASWPLEFLSAMAIHGPLEMADNIPWHFSLPAFVQRLFPGGSGWLFPVVLTVLVLALLLRVSRRVSVESSRFPAFFGLTVAATLLVSPHLQYYEAGILALPVLLGLESLLMTGGRPSLGVRTTLALGYMGFPAWRMSETLGFQPLTIVLVSVFIWTSRLAYSEKPEERDYRNR